MESWTCPGVRAFGRVNGGLAFQGLQAIADNAVPLCDVFFAEIEGTTKLLAPSNVRYVLYGNTYCIVFT